MDIDTCIKERKSCRKYHPKKVPLSLIGDIVDAGTHAPSAGNMQNWAFIVVDDQAKREKIADLCMHQEWMKHAPIHLIICNDKERVNNQFPSRGDLYATQNCAITAAYMILKAEELGLGSCWVGGFNEEGLRDLLNLPPTMTPEIVLTLGYADKWDSPPGRTQAHLITYFNTFGREGRHLPHTIFPLKKRAHHTPLKKNDLLSKSIAGIKKLQQQIKQKKLFSKK